MTTEQEWLGNVPAALAPEPAKDWAQALDQAHHHFDEAARLAAHGDIHAALAAGATGVGLAAEAAQLERDEQDGTAQLALNIEETTVPLRPVDRYVFGRDGGAL